MQNHHLGFPIETVAVFIILSVGAILIDLYAHRSDKPMSLKSASLWTVFWILVSLAFAGFLGWPCFQEVVAVEAAGDGWKLTQSTAGGTRTIRVDGPVVAAVAIDAAHVKVPGMKDILAAGKKPLEKVAVADLPTVDTALEVTGRSKPVAKARRNETFTGDDAAAQLVAALRNAGAL